MSSVMIDGKLNNIRADGSFLILNVTDDNGLIWDCKTGSDVKYKEGVNIHLEGIITGALTMRIRSINHLRGFNIEKYPYLINAIEENYIPTIPTMDETGRAIPHPDNERVKIYDIYKIYRTYIEEHNLPVNFKGTNSLGKVLSKMGLYRSKDKHFSYYWLRKRK